MQICFSLSSSVSDCICEKQRKQKIKEALLTEIQGSEKEKLFCKYQETLWKSHLKYLIKKRFHVIY